MSRGDQAEALSRLKFTNHPDYSGAWGGGGVTREGRSRGLEGGGGGVCEGGIF